jgi:hypothetical protein
MALRATDESRKHRALKHDRAPNRLQGIGEDRGGVAGRASRCEGERHKHRAREEANIAGPARGGDAARHGAFSHLAHFLSKAMRIESYTH